MRSFVLCLLLLFACSACSMSEDYVGADRSTYDAIAPRYAAYVSNDATLSPSERDSRLLTLDTWRKRLETQEGLLR